MPADPYKTIRDVLIEARKAAGLTQAELASCLNRPQSFVSKYERGERRLDLVEFGDLARVLSFDVTAFLSKLYAETSG